MAKCGDETIVDSTGGRVIEGRDVNCWRLVVRVYSCSISLFPRDEVASQFGQQFRLFLECCVDGGMLLDSLLITMGLGGDRIELDGATHPLSRASE